MLFGLFFNWAAFMDPNIHVVNFHTKDIGELGNGENKYRYIEVPVPFG
jgi:hypothetical protein